MSEPAGDERRRADYYRAGPGDLMPIGAGEMTVTLPAGCEPRRVIAIEPAAGPDAVAVSAWRDTAGVVHFDTVSREEIADMIRRLTEAWRPVAEAMRVQFEAICTALRPLAELLAELHVQYPDPAAWVIEPEPGHCHHLCSLTPDHGCLGEADGTFAYGAGGREVPMCAPCRHVAAMTAYVRLGVVTPAEFLESMGVTDRVDQGSEYDGFITSLAGAYAGPALDWGDPLTAQDADWPTQGNTCAHICGAAPDHACDARATTRLKYDLPSGGTRSMPICGPCHASETAAKEDADA
jgi:hypothetical protein